MLLGLEHLHSNNIVLGNLRPENIYCTPGGCIKLANFGLVGKKSRKMMFFQVGDYMAPE
jgi:serine/threonine protein kinase